MSLGLVRDVREKMLCVNALMYWVCLGAAALGVGFDEVSIGVGVLGSSSCAGASCERLLRCGMRSALLSLVSPLPASGL